MYFCRSNSKGLNLNMFKFNLKDYENKIFLIEVEKQNPKLMHLNKILGF